MKRLALLSLLTLSLLACNPASPTTRGGPSFDGSARWALGFAQPQITGFAADAQLYQILGSLIMKDGRLPTNQGNWSFVTWSPSQQKVFQVTVDNNGAVTTSTRAETSPPTVSGSPLPGTWANSTDVFAAAAPHLDPGVFQATLAVLNVASYSGVPNQAVWGINFNTGPNQLVKWDGTYVGPQ
jgi:hypothetical protein